MPAFARVTVPGMPHHVTQRGNYRQEIFTSTQDRLIYLEYVARAAAEYGLEIHGWCLMTNHVHWIVVPRVQNAMAASFRRPHSRFAAYINRQYKRASGHLWQGRYYSCPLGGTHFGAALLYVERNPLRAGIAKSAIAYEWSSASARVGLVPAPPYLHLELWKHSFTAQEWLRLLGEENHAEDDSKLRASTKQGKPYGNTAFIEDLECKTGRTLRVRPTGRPALAQSAAGPS